MTETLVDLSPLAKWHTGGQLLKGELLDVITTAIANQPRSLQKAIGPSELGHPCPRRIAYRMLDVPKINDDPAGQWRPTVGSAVHTWGAEAFIAANAGQSHSRWLVETRVDVGEYNGHTVTGSSDLFDILTGTVVDLKIVGVTSLRAKKAAGHPGEQYRVQDHLYGRGFTRRGLPVNTVAILALPQSGDLREAWWWSEPYDEQVALDALARATTIDQLCGIYGLSILERLPTVDAFCSYCPWFNPVAVDVTDGCKGHPTPERLAKTTPPATVADALGNR